MTSGPQQTIDPGDLEALVAEVTTEVLGRLKSGPRPLFGRKP